MCEDDQWPGSGKVRDQAFGIPNSANGRATDRGCATHLSQPLKCKPFTNGASGVDADLRQTSARGCCAILSKNTCIEMAAF